MKELSVPNYVSTYRNLFYTLHESALISYLSLQTLGQKALVQGRALRCSDVLSPVRELRSRMPHSATKNK